MPDQFDVVPGVVRIAGATRQDAARKPVCRDAAPGFIALDEEAGRFYAGEFVLPNSGTLALEIASPRPLRLWLDGTLVLDEELSWRSFQREVRAAVVVPCAAGSLGFLLEVGARPGTPEYVEQHCPSRERETLYQALRLSHPDRVRLSGVVHPGAAAPAVSLRFTPAQFRKHGIAWQKVLVRSVPGFFEEPPALRDSWLDGAEPVSLALSSPVQPCAAQELERHKHGGRAFFVPVAAPGDEPAPLRSTDRETRAEPILEVARTLVLSVEGRQGGVPVPLPAYESLGRLAPRPPDAAPRWASWEEARDLLPELTLPPALVRFGALYEAAWQMLFSLVRKPPAVSGLPASYIGTGGHFTHLQFLWDTAFTAMATAYGCRALPPCASLDLLYSRQFDGGYIHREHDTRDGLPMLWEPGFSPNPPLLSVAEWAVAAVTGDAERLRHVYPALRAMHRWLVLNRRLPNGTYWTTGLASGLDNSPSLGDGFPDLTAQMAHDAETLAQIARVLGLDDEAKQWEAERQQTSDALNSVLWDETQSIYATSQAGGGYNPNKSVTAFWPLWAGVVPAGRVEALAAHLQNPRLFWRHHPVPSLAADSPLFDPGGDYWRGSVWAPTNYAVIKGFHRMGHSGLARTTALRHLHCMADVLETTGKLWENYGSEASVPGSVSQPDYSWTALGPIALLFEVILGLTPDALTMHLHWTPPPGEAISVRRFPLGAATVSLTQVQAASEDRVDVSTDVPFTLVLERAEKTQTVYCARGLTSVGL